MRAFRIAYDGTGYRGFQRQPHGETVENELLAALAALDVVDSPTATPPGYAAAGRTDAGVSALAQTVTFEAPAWLSPRAFNSELPADVRAWASADVDASFHATHDATSRTYEYDLLAQADRTRVVATLDALSGTHAFDNLTPDETGTERTLSASLIENAPGDHTAAPSFRLRFTADGFPRQFVRRAAELVRQVGVGERDLDAIDRVLDPTPLPGPQGVPPAPPTPLVLVDVEYPNVTFTVDEDAAASAVETFDRRRNEARQRMRVTARLQSGIDATGESIREE